MGAWGGGLYDSDFGLDLKATFKGVLRAPLGEDDLLAEIRACPALLEQLEGDPRTIAERRKETAKLVERLRQPRFILPAPSGQPVDPDEPDQRPGPEP